jgi:hypothetical protein
VRHRLAEPHLGAQRIDADEALRGFQVPERSAVAGVETQASCALLWKVTFNRPARKWI